ncbi:MAG: DUF5655 domain-containing protein [Gemmatimonadaceae bacterium]
MNSVDEAFQKQLQNIQARTGKTLDELYAHIRRSGLVKHGEIRALLKKDPGMGHGDANTLATFFLKFDGQGADHSKETGTDDLVNTIYAGPKAVLRPIHDKLMSAIDEFGSFEIAPKKGYVSLRRKKQFATIGPPNKTRVDVGLNMKGVKGTARLAEMPAGAMCQYTVRLADPAEVDEELLAWIKTAYESAG